MNPEALIGFLITGALAGLIGGLIGVSGGIITVPCLLYVFTFTPIPHEFKMQFAIGTSLAGMCFNALSSCLAYQKKQLIHWNIVKKLIAGVIIGSIAGSFIGASIPTDSLQRIFGFFLAFVSLYLLRKKHLKEHVTHGIHSPFHLNFVGLCVGLLSNILGIGGGVIMMPWLLHFGYDEKKALGTSSAASLLITALGAVLYLFEGFGHNGIPNSIGFIYIPAFLAIGIISYLLAPYSVKIAIALPSKKLRFCIAVLLFVIGISMLFPS